MTKTKMMKPTFNSFLSDVRKSHGMIMGEVGIWFIQSTILFFSFTNFFSCCQVGGAMGLWLGLSVFQIVQQLINVAKGIIKKVANRFHAE